MVAFNVLRSPNSYDVSGDRVGGDADQWGQLHPLRCTLLDQSFESRQGLDVEVEKRQERKHRREESV